MHPDFLFQVLILLMIDWWALVHDCTWHPELIALQLLTEEDSKKDENTKNWVVTAADKEEEEEKDKQSCGALWAGGSSCPAAVLLGSPSVWLAANHGAG